MPVSLAVSRTGSCESLGTNDDRFVCSLGSSSPVPAAAPFLPRVCHWATENLQGLGDAVSPSLPEFLARKKDLQTPGTRRNPLPLLSEPPEGRWLCCTSQGALASGKGHLPQQGRKKMDLYLCNFFSRWAKENLIEKMHGSKPKESRVHLVDFLLSSELSGFYFLFLFYLVVGYIYIFFH